MSDEKVWQSWPAHAPSPIDHDYQCYTLTDKTAVRRYVEKFGEDPKFNIIYKRMRWLGPNPDNE